MPTGPRTQASSGVVLGLCATSRLLGAALASDGVLVALPVARLGHGAESTAAIRRLLARYRPRFVAYDFRDDDALGSFAELVHSEVAMHRATAFPVTRTETGRLLGLDKPLDLAIAAAIARRMPSLRIRTGLRPESFRSPRSENVRYWTPAFLAVAIALVATHTDSSS